MTAGLKTEGNGYFYLKATSWSGADVSEPGLLSDLMTPQGQIIDNEGDIAKITVTGRGGQFGLGVGKVFPRRPATPTAAGCSRVASGPSTTTCTSTTPRTASDRLRTTA